MIESSDFRITKMPSTTEPAICPYPNLAPWPRCSRDGKSYHRSAGSRISTLPQADPDIVFSPRNLWLMSASRRSPGIR